MAVRQHAGDVQQLSLIHILMDFEGVEKVRARVRQNGTLAQQLLQLQGQMARPVSYTHLALIVPVHHHALVGGGLAVLVDVPGHVHHPGGVPRQLRVLRSQPGSVL